MDAIAELRVAVEDQVAGSSVPWERLMKLLDDPSGRRVGGDVDVEDLTPSMMDDEEDVEDVERDGRDREEVARSDGPRWFRRKVIHRSILSGSVDLRGM
jgi:hypothetical protein